MALAPSLSLQKRCLDLPLEKNKSEATFIFHIRVQKISIIDSGTFIFSFLKTQTS